MELRDLYNENKIKTGEVIQKGQAIPVGKYYLTVVVFIQNFKGEFLIQQRVPEKNNKWATTGGHPVSGETSLSGLVNEIKEEIGILIDKNKVELFKTIRTEDDFVDLYYLNMDINLDDVVLQEIEVQDIKWLTKEKIYKLIKNNEFSESNIGFFEDCLNYLNKKNNK